jgi:integrase
MQREALHFDTGPSGMQDKDTTTPVRPRRDRGKPVAVVKQGSAAVPIYRGMCRKSVRFTVAFYRDGRRRRLTFGNLDAAKDEARRIALNIQRGMSSDNDLRPQDRETFRTAMNMLAPLGLPLLGCLEEYVTCRRDLGSVPLRVAVEAYKSRTAGVEAGVTVERIVEEMLLAKTQDRLSSMHIKDLRSLYHRFARAFPGAISEITTPQLDAWIRKGEFTITTRNNRLRRMKMLFTFAKERGYLPKNEPTAIEMLKPVKSLALDVGLFTPGEMDRLMQAASPQMIPFLAIGGFAGLRVEEICRLDWSAVHLDRRMIELRASQAKTASRRIVPMSENLAAWLAPLARQGAVIPNRLFTEKVRKFAHEIGVGWPRNALRHSYISYRVAEIQNVAQVALEAGNSPAIIFKHYRELVTREDAQKWFSIFPANASASSCIDTANAA